MSRKAILLSFTAAATVTVHALPWAGPEPTLGAIIDELGWTPKPTPVAEHALAARGMMPKDDMFGHLGKRQAGLLSTCAYYSDNISRLLFMPSWNV